MQIGDQVGEWVALSCPFLTAGSHKRKVRMRCSCGVERDVYLHSLMSGGSQSCGHTHREARNEIRTREYAAWSNMKSRCYYKDGPAYPDYGGRGIRVCDQWINSYETFLKDVGRKPTKNHSLDRIDVNGNYEPGNVRWATRDVQNANYRRSGGKRITLHGVTKTVPEWAEDMGISKHTILSRLASGWDEEKSITTPSRSVR